ncbi:MAG TPA: HEAT repeat domain-containing protein [Tepidisphaeraceae bacterium]|jgi:hypothetical protein|nr:HEAT repeat domain-containing protein [Tepidisphaeraceae bacterium]
MEFPPIPTILTDKTTLRMNRIHLPTLLFFTLLVGCSTPEKASITSNDPSLSIPAIEQAGHNHDTSSISQLVKHLDSDDPAVRFYSITALKEITGNTFDYRYYDDEIHRLPALKRWQQWLKEPSGAPDKQNSAKPQDTNAPASQHT